VLQEALQALMSEPGVKSFSKYQRLLTQLRAADFGWQVDEASDRLVIFSERIETLNWLAQQLGADLKLKKSQLEVLHGATHRRAFD
jgi:hypothetical protein